MATTEEIQRRLDTIETAMASGATRVSYDGKSVDYVSLAQMRQIRDELRRQLGLPGPARRTLAGHSRGFY